MIPAGDEPEGVFWGRLRIVISVLGSELLSVVEIEAFLGASEGVRFEGNSRAEVYGWVERLLCRHEYLATNARPCVFNTFTHSNRRVYAEPRRNVHCAA